MLVVSCYAADGWATALALLLLSDMSLDPGIDGAK
jgi:hypothetical protein